MKRMIIMLMGMALGMMANAQQKEIYVPEDLRGMDLQSDTSKWSFQRSTETADLIFMWERGFGNDTSTPPRSRWQAHAL